MDKMKTQSSKWQYWLSFSAFTLAGVAMEGSTPAAPPLQQAAPKAKKWRSVN